MGSRDSKPIIKNSTETNKLQGDIKRVIKNLIDLYKEKEYNKHQPTLKRSITNDV